VVPAVAHGIRVVSMAFLLPKDQKAVVWRGPMVGKMVEQLLLGVAWGPLDYLVVDLPPGTGDAVLSLAQKVPLSGAVVVTTPQEVALADVLKAVDMFRAVRVPVLGVVENMAGFKCPKCGEVTHVFLEGAGRRAAEDCDIPLLGSLPLDPAVPPGGDEGRPIVVDRPESVISKGFAEIARALEARLEEMDEQPPQFDLGWSSGA
jgi:ATP-binding protein involved in chromosome partitioning